MRAVPVLVVLSCVCASAVVAQDVLVVDAHGGAGSQYTTIQAAVNAAQDGDIVLVRAATYYDESLEIVAKGITVTAEAGADVILTEGVTIQFLGAGQTTVLRGLRIEPDTWPLNDDKYGLRALSCSGSIRVEACTLFAKYIQTEWGGGPVFDAADVQDCQSLVFVDCILMGGKGSRDPGQGSGGAALRSQQSRVAAFGCDFVGGTASSVAEPPGLGGDGALVEQGSLYAAGCTFTGGPGGIYPLGGNGIRGLSTHLDLLDNAYYVKGGQPLLLGESTVAQLSGYRHRLSMTSPVREGQVLQLAARGAPGEFVTLLVSLDTHHQFVPALEAPLLVALSPALIAPVGLVPGGSLLELSLGVGNLPPVLEGATLNCQAVFSTRNELSLSNTTAVVVLDASL